MTRATPLAGFVIRAARPNDAPDMADVLAAIIAVTGQARPHDTAFVQARYIDHPDQRACFVAVDTAERVLGFQALKYASRDNDYGVTPGWGIIGTHIDPDAHRRGIGTALFEQTARAARRHGLVTIEATIGADNPSGLAYYEAMGFRTYRPGDRVVHKKYELGPVDVSYESAPSVVLRQDEA